MNRLEQAPADAALPSHPSLTTFYRCFGLLVESEVPIVELEPVLAGVASVRISRGKVGRPLPSFPAGRAHEFGAAEDYFGLAMIGNYLIRDNCIIFDEAAELPESFAGFSLLGPVMAGLMHRLGKLVLHGSALATQYGAVIILGDKGAGKSTTAGALVTAGLQLISDDIIAVSFDRLGVPVVTPAYPVMKLSDQALTEFGEGPFRRVSNPTAYTIKNRLIVSRGVPDAPVPIAAVYELARGGAEACPRFQALASQETLRLLLAHAYMARYGKDAFHRPGAMAAHLRQCGDLATRVQVARLTVPGSLAGLRGLAGQIENDLAEHAR